MSDQGLPSSLTSLLALLASRRRFLSLAGSGVIGVGIAGSALGHSDDDHDDDDRHRDRDRDRDRDDNDIRPLSTVPPGSAEVVIDDDDADGFDPGTITIDVGESVTWVNLDDDAHSATGAEFDTGIMHPGELATVMFDVPGIFPYSCQLHPVMTGVVEVRDASGNVPTGTERASPDASPAATPQATSGELAEVAIDKLAFDPAETTVTAGTTIRWTNREAIPHTVRSTTGDFDSGIMELGDEFEYTFGAAGVFDYICGLHPSMEGRVIVEG